MPLTNPTNFLSAGGSVHYGCATSKIYYSYYDVILYFQCSILNRIWKVTFDNNMGEIEDIRSFVYNKLAQMPGMCPAVLEKVKTLSEKSFVKTKANTHINPKANTHINPGGGPTADYEKLPGIYEKVETPCVSCRVSGNVLPLGSVIIHLNDYHKWTKNEIADWLETLNIDLRFKTGEENETNS